MIAPLSGLPEEPSEAERVVCSWCGCRVSETDAVLVRNRQAFHRDLGCYEHFAVAVLRENQPEVYSGD